VLEYDVAWDLQRRLVAARIDGTLDRDVALMLEHPAVFTVGRRGGRDNLRVPETYLSRRGIPLVQIERGGDITYHGPGQLVVYPIVDLRAARCRIPEFVDCLEETMIRTLAEWGIRGYRDTINRGVWAESAKIGSLGIAVRRSISFHGLALNANTSLEPFRWIHPCGLAGVAVTSMQRILGRHVEMTDVRKAMAKHFQEIVGVGVEEISPAQLCARIGTGVETSGDNRLHGASGGRKGCLRI